jgi:hypothetical protein
MNPITLPKPSSAKPFSDQCYQCQSVVSFFPSSDPRLSALIRGKTLPFRSRAIPVMSAITAILHSLRFLPSSAFQGFGLGPISVISVNQW